MFSLILASLFWVQNPETPLAERLVKSHSHGLRENIEGKEERSATRTVLVRLTRQGTERQFDALMAKHRLRVPHRPQRLYKIDILVLEVTKETPSMKKNPVLSSVLDACEALEKEEIVEVAAPDTSFPLEPEK